MFDLIERQSAMYIRDTQVCTCGHKNVSHGSFDPHGYFAGIGNGPCGIDNDTRNCVTGWTGDPCPCTRFEVRA